MKKEESVAVCSGCGAPREPRAKYCWRCGAKLDQRTPVEPYASRIAGPRSKVGYSRILTMILISVG
ncbi:MAG: hypothetical protein QW512_01810 [Thermofilaceae archaeon]